MMLQNKIPTFVDFFKIFYYSFSMATEFNKAEFYNCNFVERTCKFSIFQILSYPVSLSIVSRFWPFRVVPVVSLLNGS